MGSLAGHDKGERAALFSRLVYTRAWITGGTRIHVPPRRLTVHRNTFTKQTAERIKKRGQGRDETNNKKMKLTLLKQHTEDYMNILYCTVCTLWSLVAFQVRVQRESLSLLRLKQRQKNLNATNT